MQASNLKRRDRLMNLCAGSMLGALMAYGFGAMDAVAKNLKVVKRPVIGSTLAARAPVKRLRGYGPPSLSRAAVPAGRTPPAKGAEGGVQVANEDSRADTASRPSDVQPPAAAANGTEPDASRMTMDQFLDRLMTAESGGRLDARNPRSTAVGPFQFIESTFRYVVRRHFAEETAKLTPAQVLALRVNMDFARRAAEAYTRDNAATLVGFDVPASFPHLRLAFLLGPAGAAKVIKAPPETPLTGLLGPAVLVANPFMASLTAGGLVHRSAREVAQPANTRQGVEVPAGTARATQGAAPVIAVACNLRLPSCKRWLALQTAKVTGRRDGRVAGVSSSRAAKANAKAKR